MFASFTKRAIGSVALANKLPAVIERKFLLIRRFNRSAPSLSTRAVAIAYRPSMLSTAVGKCRQVLPSRKKCRNFSSPTEKPSNGVSQTTDRMAGESSKSAGTAKEDGGLKGWLQWFLGPKPMPERHTFAWYREVTLICTVFAITGSSTMVVSISAAVTQNALPRRMPASVKRII